MANDFVQTMADARVDARSLSDFMFYPASEMVQRRLAPSIHTLNYYLDYFNGLEALYSQESGTVKVNGVEIKTVRQAMNDAVDDVLLGEYQEGVRSDLNAQKLDTGITATAKFGGVERQLSDKLSDTVTIDDFGITDDGTTDELDKLNIIAGVVDVVDLQGKTVYSSALPVGDFVNGVIKTDDQEYYFGLLPATKQGYRVATWNVWSTYSAELYFNDNVFSPKRMFELKRRLLEFGFNAVGLQETHVNPVVYPTYKYIVSPFMDAASSASISYNGGNKYGNITLTDKSITSREAVIYDSAPTTGDKEYRSYINTKHTVNSKTVSIYNTHLSLNYERMQEMAAQLCAAAVADTSDVVFVMGDFNTDQWQWFSSLISNGFSQLNNGTIDTNPTPEHTWFIDDIFYKGTTVIGTAQTYFDTRIGDHSALWADFNI